MRSLLASLASLILLTGCSHSTSSEPMTRYHDDGRAKPMVALLPISDKSETELPWNLSEELTYSVYNRVAKRGVFWINTFAECVQNAKRIHPSHNFFSKDVSWVKEYFPDHEFVVFCELVEHDIHERAPSNSFLDRITPSNELEMAVRIRVLDVREEPRVILQEVVTQKNMINKQTALDQQDPEQWKHLTYSISPLGYSHSQFSKEIVRRIEEYIILAKSR